MKLKKAIGTMMVVALLTSNVSFADAPSIQKTMTADEVKLKVTEYSLTLKQLKDGLEALEKGYVSAVQGENMAGQLLYDYENYKKMYEAGTGELAQNKGAYAVYQAMFGSSPSYSNEEIYNKFAKSAVMADESTYIQLQSMILDLKVTQISLENTVDQLISTVSTLKSGIKLQGEALQLSKKQHADLLLKYKLGKISSAELNKSSLNLKKSELEMTKMKRSLSSLEMQLKNLMGEDLGATINFTYKLTPKPSAKISDYAYYEKEAVLNRGEVIKAKLNYESSLKASEVAKKYLFNEQLVERINVQNDLMVAESNYITAINNVKKDILKAYQAYTNAKVQLEILSDKLTDSKNQLDKLNALYKTGYVNTAQVLAAELDYKNQIMNYENGIIEYNKSYDALILKSGVGVQSAGGN